MDPIKAIFKLRNPTKHMYRFMEVDSNGDEKEADDRQFGDLYIKKSTFKDMDIDEDTIMVITLDISEE